MGTQLILRISFAGGLILILILRIYVIVAGGLILGLNAKGERLRHWANLVRGAENTKNR